MGLALNLVKPFIGKLGPKLGPIALQLARPLLDQFAPEEVIHVQGSTMLVDRKDLYRYLVFINQGSHEPLQTELFKQVVRKGQTVVDVGAHVGFYTLLAARLVGKQGRVYAFEPRPENFELLSKNVKLNRYDNAFLVRKAISDKTGTARFWLHPCHSGAHSLLQFKWGKEYTYVEVTTLDEFFKSDGYGPIDAIKIDIEGAEMLALLGMEKILKRNQNLKLFIEFSPLRLRQSGYDPEVFVNKLMKHRFKLHLVDERKKRVEPISAEELMKLAADEKLLTNLFLTRPHSERW